jgi:hypothetical protein
MKEMCLNDFESVSFGLDVTAVGGRIITLAEKVMTWGPVLMSIYNWNEPYARSYGIGMVDPTNPSGINATNGHDSQSDNARGPFGTPGPHQSISGGLGDPLGETPDSIRKPQNHTI